MRLPIRAAVAGQDGSLGMMPMIDVVFLLLVYFVWTSSFDIPELDLPGSIAAPVKSAAGNQLISEDPPPTPEAFDEIIVRIRRDGVAETATINDQSVADEDDLMRRIATIISLGVQPPVIIDPDSTITMRTAVAYYDAARRGGADRVMFAVQAE